MTDINIKNTRRVMEPQYLICNNLIATGQCMIHPHCRYQHIPALMCENIIPEYSYDNFNSSPCDPSFNWNLSDDNKNMDKRALSMLLYLINNTAHKNTVLKDDSKNIFNTITKKRRLPIFYELSTIK